MTSTLTLVSSIMSTAVAPGKGTPCSALTTLGASAGPVTVPHPGAADMVKTVVVLRPVTLYPIVLEPNR